MKKLLAMIISFIMLLSLSACGSGSTTQSSKGNEVKQDENGVILYPFDEPIIALDNEYVCIQIDGKMYVDPDNSGNWSYAGGAVGYSYIIENKLSDASLSIHFTNASIDGFMLSDVAGPNSTIMNFDAGKKGKGFFYFALDGRDLGVDLKTVDDLHDFEASVILSFDEDGKGYGRSYHGNNIPDMPLLTTLP